MTPIRTVYQSINAIWVLYEKPPILEERPSDTVYDPNHQKTFVVKMIIKKGP